MKARRHSVADQTEPNAVQFGPSAGKSSDARFRSPTTKAPKPRKASAGEKSIHLWAVASQAVVKAIRCVSNRTRPVSWLGPESSGVHPHTKGARCSAGGHRHRIPSTASGLLPPRIFARQGVMRPLAYRRKHLDQGNRGERDPGRNDLLALQAVMGLQGAHTVAEGNARWGVPRGAGGVPRRRQQPAWQRETWASARLRRPTPLAWRCGLACRGFDRLRALAVRVAAA